jgi:hypothetical protein
MRSKGFAGKNFLMRKFPYDSSPSPTFPAPKLASWIGIG